MATTLLDAFQTTSDAYPANFAISSAANRRAYLAVIRTSGTNADPPTAASIGGVSVSPLAVADDGASMDVVCALFEWIESQIASMSGSAVSVTGGAGANYATVYWSVQDATQSAITPVTDITPGTTSSVSLVRVADSYTVAVTVHDISSGAYTSLADPAQTGTLNITNGVVAWAGAADTARTASFTWSHASSRENAAIALNIAPAASGPTISSLGDTTPNYQGSTTITGTGFPTSQTGSAAAHLGGVAQTVTWNTSTSCSIASIARGNLAYGNYNLTVTDAAGNTSANYATSLSPQAGWKYITTSGTLADPSLRLTTTPVDIVSGNQISVGNVVGGTEADITLYVDGSYSCAASVISFDYEVHDGTEWGAVGTEYPSTPAGRRGLIRSLARPLARSLVEALTN